MGGGGGGGSIDNYSILLLSLDLYLLLTEFEGRTGSYRPSSFPFDLWPKREDREG